MRTTTSTRSAHVALIGNPNTGKSTLFGALVGARQRVGNYPGVTVEKKTGTMLSGDIRFEVADLPGTYSLAPRARDEMVAVDVLLGRGPDRQPVDAVLCIVDASNLGRNLYLVSQVLELGLPVVVALNMIDVARDRGVQIDVEALEQKLGVPVVPTEAHRGRGLERLREALASAIGGPAPRHRSPLPEAFQREVDRVQALLVSRGNEDGLPRYLAGRLLLETNGYLERLFLSAGDEQWRTELAASRRRLAESGFEIPGLEPAARYRWVESVVDRVSHAREPGRPTASDRIDAVLTHPILGTLGFLVIVVVMFQAVFSWAQPLMEGIDWIVSLAGRWIELQMAPGALRSLLVDGVVAGVGGVLVFLPQIMILFLFIAVLEDCGYMARAAYLMDRLMSRVGLSGKSFIPMLSSFACAIPGIMATRVIEDERDRMTTILIVPLMTCSARLPVYALLIAAFVPAQSYFGGFLTLQGITLTALYLLGIVVAVVVALVLKRTLFMGHAPPFVMEMPGYRWPSPRTVFYRVSERGWLFVRCAGSMILAVSIVVWAALYFPHNPEVVEAPYAARKAQLEAALGALPAGEMQRGAMEEELARLETEIAGAYQRQSILARLGRAVEPVFRPLGWDWRISCAVVASFPAREVVVATMGVIFNAGDAPDDESTEAATRFRAKLQQATWEGSQKKLFNLPVALSIMVFFALCCQCAATLAVIRRETNSWRWPLFAFTYMTVLAYFGALVAYQVGSAALG